MLGARSTRLGLGSACREQHALRRCRGRCSSPPPPPALAPLLPPQAKRRGSVSRGCWGHRRGWGRQAPPDSGDPPVLRGGVAWVVFPSLRSLFAPSASVQPLSSERADCCIVGASRTGSCCGVTIQLRFHWHGPGEHVPRVRCGFPTAASRSSRARRNEWVQARSSFTARGFLIHVPGCASGGRHGGRNAAPSTRLLASPKKSSPPLGACRTPGGCLACPCSPSAGCSIWEGSGGRPGKPVLLQRQRACCTPPGAPQVPPESFALGSRGAAPLRSGGSRRGGAVGAAVADPAEASRCPRSAGCSRLPNSSGAGL